MALFTLKGSKEAAQTAATKFNDHSAVSHSVFDHRAHPKGDQNGGPVGRRGFMKIGKKLHLIGF